MDQLDLWLSLLFTVTLAALIMPGVVAMNHGKLLRNTALWLGIFLALALIYRNFGPFDTTGQNLPPPAQTTEDSSNAHEPGQHIEINK